MADGTDLFDQIKNAVFDLQQSDYQGFARPLKTLGRLIRHPDLERYNRLLTEAVDFDAFIAESEKTQGGMMGSATLVWPDEKEKELGLSLLLIEKLAADSDYAVGFANKFFHSSSPKIIACIHSLTSQFIVPFVRDYKSYVLSDRGSAMPRLVRPKTNKVFIVHGHDGEAREAVARYLTNIGFNPIILHERANRGRTIIEKVEAEVDVSFVVVLLTPDDEGRANGGNLEPRARQNVLLELGYFIGLLGRSNVCALMKGTVEIPSDFAGIVWHQMDDGGGWKQRLGKELEAADHLIDWNKVMRA